MPHGVLVSTWAGRTRWWRWNRRTDSVALIVRSQLLHWLRMLLDVGKTAAVVQSWRRLALWSLRGSRSTPLRTWRTVDSSRLISLWMDILWQRCGILIWHATCRLSIL